MQLQGNDAICPALLDIFIGDVNGGYAIDFVNKVVAAGDNMIIVPVFFLDLLLNLV